MYRIIRTIFAFCIFSGGSIAAAQEFPTRPVRMIVGFAAGGPTDILARVVAQALSERLGQQFVVENRVGAGSNTATESVINAQPDGYTILVISTSNAINTSFYQKLPFDFMRDVTPVAGLGRVSYVMAISPSVPAKSVAEFITYAKSKPGSINFVSAGVGSSNHLTGEMFKAIAGIDMVHVAYRGNAAAYSDLIADRVQLIFADLASSEQHVRSGALRGLAITSPHRSEKLPDVPALAETIPGFEASAWYGFGVPKGTPERIVIKLNHEINSVLTDPKVRARLDELSASPIIMSPLEFGAFMKSEAERWGKVVRAAGVKAE
jgi:tripartite-type tricarboxylate transporter receptor subunit TctC